MKRTLKSWHFFSILPAIVLLVITCKKEYSYEGGAASAVYTFNGAGGGCTNSIVSGNYVTGVPLDASNTVQLGVYVTKAGSFIQSISSNGISFSGSGVFTDTGSQTITLAATGTPVSDGSFAFATSGSSCTFSVTVSMARPPKAEFTLAGSPNDCSNAMVKGNYVYGDALTATNRVDMLVDVKVTGPYIIKTDTLDGISFYAAGNFTAKGVQTVTLAGTGTPDIPGNFSFRPLADSSYCTFTIPVTNAQPLAIYVLESGFGSPSPCIYTVKGTYAAGTALQSSNTVTINVFATQAGNFTIETNTVNGISFYYSGTFSTSGVQKVTLYGRGTPVSGGTFNMIPQIVGPHPLGGQSCAFSIDIP